jgi:glyoxylase-like metal-dependent hydrolase (beta-lactamase superfamily II)
MVEVLKGVHAIDLTEGGGLGLEAWLINAPEGLVLIDTGMRESAIDRIGAELESMGKAWGDIDKVLITHKHGDHVRNLSKVVELSGAEVLSHEEEAPLIKEATGVDVRGMKHGEVLDYLGGIEVIHVPGHSEGNASYYLPARKAIIAGDTIFGDDEGTLETPPERYCLDVRQAEREVGRLLNYDFDALLITHGKDTLKGAKDKVKDLCK